MGSEYNTVVPLLRKICREAGKNIALLGTKELSLSYGELGRRVQALSCHLRRNVGVKAGQAIGVCMDRGFDHIVTILGVLDAGAAYVPLDPDLPQKRLAYMISDAQLTLILAQRKYTLDLETVLYQQAKSNSTQLMFLDGLIKRLLSSLQVDVELQEEVLSEPDPEDLANIIYTSGSTGEPKGVMVLHKGLLPMSLTVGEVWELKRPDSRMLQFSSHCFDASTAETFAALCSGATLVLGSREELLPGQQLADFIRSHRVSATLLPPSVLATLNEFSSSLTDLRTVIAGGEACTLALARKWSSPHRRFVNAYGPTECTVITTMHVFDGASDKLKTVPLGESLPGWEVHLLNDQLETVNDGEVGEIYISGVGLSRGYLNKAEVTRKYFVPHPQTGLTLYRSGDLGVRRGTKRLLEYSGRVDNQIKINGFRVELGAVEQALCEHPAVEYAAVKAVEANKDGSNHMLVAYVVLHEKAIENHFSSEFLNYFLLDRLPKYMVPPLYVSMDALPLTANGGKIDRKALPHPFTLPNLNPHAEGKSGAGLGGPGHGTEVDTGLNVMMSQCCAIFEEVLNLESGLVKIDSNFFHLGGSSLWVSRLVSELRETFDVELLAWQVYKQPTPQQLVLWILAKKKMESKSFVLQDVGTDVLLKEAHSLDKALRPTGGGKLSSNVALVTGATGFLGVFLLENLLARGPFQVIYCLVRAKSPTHALERLQATRVKYGLQKTSSNVELVMLVGDVQQSKLGLSRESYAQLCSHVDVIYHVAADTNYIRPYEEMRRPNVEGTRNILHFAATGPSTKTLQYVSTIGIYGSLSGFMCDVLEENFDMERCLSYFSRGETGYTKSKWVAEIMVLDFMSRGFPVSIYRPGFIEAHSDTGIANTDDMMCRYIKGCIQMGSYPRLPKKFWEPIPVNFAADAIAYISLVRKPGQIYNLVPDREREMGNQAIFEFLREDRHCQVEELSISHWLDALSNVPAPNALYPLIAYLSEKIHENRYTPLEMPIAKFCYENTREALQGSDIEVPSFDRSILKHYVQFLDLQAWLERQTEST